MEGNLDFHYMEGRAHDIQLFCTWQSLHSLAGIWHAIKAFNFTLWIRWKSFGWVWVYCIPEPNLVIGHPYLYDIIFLSQTKFQVRLIIKVDSNEDQSLPIMPNIYNKEKEKRKRKRKSNTCYWYYKVPYWYYKVPSNED